jgi:hypothetical protein
MQSAINEILSKTTTKTADYTYAHATLGYSEDITSQVTIENKLKDILTLCDHIGYWEGNTLHVIDLLVGGVTIALPSYNVKEITSKLDTNVVSSFNMKYTTREHNGGGIDGPPTLDSKTQTATLSTGIDGGVDKNISSNQSASIISGSDIIYDTTNIDLILSRKKTMSEREPITIKANDFIDYNIGTKITFDTTFQSGYLIIESLKYDEDKIETTIQGRGSYTGKAN